MKIAFEPVHQLSGASSGESEIFFSDEAEDQKHFSEIIDRLIVMKSEGYPIIHSKTYLKRLRDGNRKITCHINQSILAVDNSGNLYNCRIHDKPLGNILETNLEDVWKKSENKRKEIRKNCDGCLFFGYMENNLLLNYNVESLFGYEWL